MAALFEYLAHRRSRLCYRVHGGTAAEVLILQADRFHGHGMMSWQLACMQTSSAASSSEVVDLAEKKQVQYDVIGPILFQAWGLCAEC